MSTKVVLRFLTESDETFSMTIPDAKDNLSSGEISSCMDMLLITKPFSTTRGVIREKRDAQVIKTETLQIS